MKGQIAITKTEIEGNKMGWGKIDFFKHYLKRYTDDPSAGWYAYIVRDGIYYFSWCNNEAKPPSKYLEVLKNDGYTLAYSIN